MNQITRGANNTLVFTLNEFQTLDNPYFLFRMLSEGLGTEKAFIISSVDNLSSVERYDKFIFTESHNEILTSGTASLQEGTWQYEVYEQTSSINLDFRSATNPEAMEKGLIKVDGPPTSTFKKPEYNSSFVWQSRS